VKALLMKAGPAQQRTTFEELEAEAKILTKRWKQLNFVKAEAH